jgi:hypothetical protein
MPQLRGPQIDRPVNPAPCISGISKIALVAVCNPGWTLANSDLPSHAIQQLLGVVADPGLKHRLDVLDLVNPF